VRALNHATICPGLDNYQVAADVDTVLGHLADLAARLPQSLDQADGWLSEALHAGRLRHDQGADVTATLRGLRACLAEATEHAQALHEALRQAREHTSHLVGTGGGALW